MSNFCSGDFESEEKDSETGEWQEVSKKKGRSSSKAVRQQGSERAPASHQHERRAKCGARTHDEPQPNRRARAITRDEPQPNRRARAITRDEPQPNRRARAITRDEPQPNRRARAITRDEPQPNRQTRASTRDEPQPTRQMAVALHTAGNNSRVRRQLNLGSSGDVLGFLAAERPQGAQASSPKQQPHAHVQQGDDSGSQAAERPQCPQASSPQPQPHADVQQGDDSGLHAAGRPQGAQASPPKPQPHAEIEQGVSLKWAVSAFPEAGALYPVATATKDSPEARPKSGAEMTAGHERPTSPTCSSTEGGEALHREAVPATAVPAASMPSEEPDTNAHPPATAELTVRTCVPHLKAGDDSGPQSEASVIIYEDIGRTALQHSSTSSILTAAVEQDDPATSLQRSDSPLESAASTPPPPTSPPHQGQASGSRMSAHAPSFSHSRPSVQGRSRRRARQPTFSTGSMMPLEIPPPFPPMPPLPLPPGPAYSGYAGSMVWPDQHGALAAEGTSSNIYMPEPWTTWQAAPMPGYAHAHQELSPGTVMGVPVPGFYPASVGYPEVCICAINM